MEDSTDEFLTVAKQILFNLFSRAPNASASEVQAEFSRTANVTTGVAVDSLTIEIPLRKNHLSREYYWDYSEGVSDFTTRWNASAASDGNFYYDLDLDYDCSRDACLVTEPEYDVFGNEALVEPQVHALATCLNVNGTEDSMLQSRYGNYTSRVSDFVSVASRFSCSTNSKSSMFTVSVGRRI